MGVKKLSELQLELLKIYSFNPSNEDLIKIRKILAVFFADKLTNHVQKAIEKKNITDEDLENWLNEKS
jgi:transcriptional regulator NrdR family protein